ncbi:MAG: hypothetical protein RIQ55_400 [Pseudomonadota bacterium]|jgi:hypothetical protein
MYNQLDIFLFESQFLPVVLVASLGLAVWAGRRLGLYQKARAAGAKVKLDEISVAAIFGLMSLLVTFTFSGAYERFEKRRVLLVEEYNTISTAYDAVDLLPPAHQPKIRDDFRNLMDQRIELYLDVVDSKVLEARLKLFEATLSQLWKDSVAAVNATPYPRYLVAAELLTAIAKMNTALENRKMALNQHPPKIIYQLLVLLLIIGAFMAGYNQATTDSRDWTMVPIYVLVTVAVFYITINLEHPLLGLISLDDYHAEVASLRQEM